MKQVKIIKATSKMKLCRLCKRPYKPITNQQKVCKNCKSDNNVSKKSKREGGD